MVNASYWVIQDQGLTTAPTDLTGGDQPYRYLLKETQDASTDWTGQEGKVATWTLSNWSISGPQVGDRFFDRDTTDHIGSKADYLYDGSNWIRMSEPGILSGTLASDFTIDTTIATTWQQVNTWETSAESITGHSWFYNNDGTATDNGVFTVKNRNQRLVEITASVMFGFVSGTQSTTCEARLEKWNGSAWAAIPATTHGEGLLNASGMTKSSATLCAKVTLNEGHRVRIMARRSNGSAAVAVLAEGTRIDMLEVLGV